MVIALLKNILRRPPRRHLPELPLRPLFRDHDGDMPRLPPIAGAAQMELLLLMMKR